MKNESEKILSKPEAQKESWRLELDEEFGRYAEAVYAGIGKEFEEMAKLGVRIANKSEDIIAKRKKEYESLDFAGRVSELTNDFYFWWPGGFYRQLLQERKEEEKDSAGIAADEKLIADLDAVIRELGYENFSELVLNAGKKSAEDRDSRAKIIGEVFIKMRAKGYDTRKLRK